MNKATTDYLLRWLLSCVERKMRKRSKVPLLPDTLCPQGRFDIWPDGWHTPYPLNIDWPWSQYWRQNASPLFACLSQSLHFSLLLLLSLFSIFLFLSLLKSLMTCLMCTVYVLCAVLCTFSLPSHLDSRMAKSQVPHLPLPLVPGSEDQSTRPLVDKRRPLFPC